MTRFNEAIDEVLTESITRYAAKTDLYRDQFVGILSHDLRSPLNAITAGAALLAASAHDDQRQGRIAARILTSAQRMNRMIGDLLDLTRTRLGGAIPLKCEPIDLQQLCIEVPLEVKVAHPDTVVHFRASGPVTGAWDADRLAVGCSAPHSYVLGDKLGGMIPRTAAHHRAEAGRRVVAVPNHADTREMYTRAQRGGPEHRRGQPH